MSGSCVTAGGNVSRPTAPGLTRRDATDGPCCSPSIFARAFDAGGVRYIPPVAGTSRGAVRSELRLTAMDIDEKLVEQAIELARQARAAGDHPFGALLVLDG